MFYIEYDLNMQFSVLYFSPKRVLFSHSPVSGTRLPRWCLDSRGNKWGGVNLLENIRTARPVRTFSMTDKYDSFAFIKTFQ